MVDVGPIRRCEDGWALLVSSASRAFARSLTFDETGHFIIYPSIIGVKARRPRRLGAQAVVRLQLWDLIVPSRVLKLLFVTSMALKTCILTICD